MLSENDLLVAMERGIISRQQLDQLERFAAERESELRQTVRDEAPRFVRNFGDLFVAIGVGILIIGLTSAISALSGSGVFIQLLAPVILWGLAEWITGRLRLSAPSIVLAIAFSAFVYVNSLALGQYLVRPEGNGVSHEANFIAAAITILANFLFYARFRLPFCLMIFGVLAFFSAAFGVVMVFGDQSDVIRWALLASGIGLFILAMWFDVKDLSRATRSSDAAFWLHLVSAPVIVHSTLFGTISWGNLDKMFKTAESGTSAFSSETVLLAAALLIGFTIIAILIDRRAFLVASLSYGTAVLAYAIWSLNLPQETIFAVTLILLASIVLALGTGWRRIRRFIFSVLPKSGLTRYLPPVDA